MGRSADLNVYTESPIGDFRHLNVNCDGPVILQFEIRSVLLYLWLQY
jgi:hypothetical protein